MSSLSLSQEEKETYWKGRIVAIMDKWFADLSSLEGESALRLMRDKLAEDIGYTVLSAFSDGVKLIK